MTAIPLLDASGRVTTVTLHAPAAVTRPPGPLRARQVFAAAHVIPHAWGDNTPGSPGSIDWDATLGFRRHLWSWGLGVADAMDTAQRNQGLDPAVMRELISRSAQAAHETDGGHLVVGVSTDQVTDRDITVRQVTDAYVEQVEFAESCGANIVVMASRHLAYTAEHPDDYEKVYAAVLDRATAPVIIHWLGDAFDPALAGYFGSPDIAQASEVLLRIIQRDPGKVAGVKMSLLDASAEIAVRRRLPEGVAMFTGDDFNYVDLIAGDDQGYSDALLGAFAAIAPQASTAVQALDRRDTSSYHEILGPTQDLARQVFSTPTYYYKTDIAFLSWLNGHQDAFCLLGGQQGARSLPHLSDTVRLANECGALENPDLAAHRWHSLLSVNGLVP